MYVHICMYYADRFFHELIMHSTQKNENTNANRGDRKNVYSMIVKGVRDGQKGRTWKEKEQEREKGREIKDSWRFCWRVSYIKDEGQ